MLVELTIRKMALIEECSLSFGRGLNVITGETGAGKSLLVGALELLLGQRPRAGLVRAGSRQLSVEGRFILAETDERAKHWLAKHLPEVLDDWEDEESERELVIGRSIADDGKSRAYVNHRPVTLRVLRELAARLIEVHGQNDHQRLLEPAEQLRLVDTFGGLEAQLRAYRDAREQWIELAERLARLRAEESQRRDRLDVARFQCAEIEAAGIDAKEHMELVLERDLLRHADGLREALGGLVDELCDSDAAVLARLQRAHRLLEARARDVGALAAPRDELEQAIVHVEESSRALRTVAQRVERDPARLEAVEERLSTLERLERKYRTDASGLLAHAAELRLELERLESEERSLHDLSPEVVAARARLLEHGGQLRRARKALATKLKRAVQKNLKELGLERAEFDLRLGQRVSDDDAAEGAELVALDESQPANGEVDHGLKALASFEDDRARFGERGMDRIEFLLAANPGEGLARLRNVASGGETARIMLALRSVLSGADQDHSLVFDEIDSGVGGRLGPAVGAHLRRIATKNQVLCVTHLPAIAALAERHLRVSKSVQGGRTQTRVEELSGEARVQEVADMIAGGAAHETARAEARRLISG
ncbi:MAG TPA: DNA repair protein RecN [Planctomycetota bacterium]|nr:DNA repair protein RecN [Planctomycetota bacterium]